MAQTSAPPIANLRDIEELERLSLEERGMPDSTYELIRQSAERHPHKRALTFLLQGDAEEAPFELTYAQLLARVTQAANAFHHLGVRPGQAVSFLLPNLPHTHFTIWGGEAAGVVNAINPLLEPEHIAELVHAADSRVLVTLAPFPGTDLWDKVAGLRERLPTLSAIVTVDLANLLPEPQRSAIKAQRGPLPEGVLDFDELLDRFPADHLQSGRVIAPDDVASYFHTGGTTGTPKLAPHSHRNEVAMAMILAYAINLGRATTPSAACRCST